MSPSFWPRGGLPGILHHYTETLTAFEFTSHKAHKPHSLIFIGGLGDGLTTTSYLADLATGLEPTTWSIFSLNTTSSYTAWGLGHLDRDTDEVAECVRYVQQYKQEKFGSSKVVLMGHSTGSQNVLHYLYRTNPPTSKASFDSSLCHTVRPPIDGAIMQAPVSDREAIKLVLRDGFQGRTPVELQAVWAKLEVMAKEASHSDQAFDTLLPLWMTSQIYPANTPISARRFLSLISPQSPDNPSEDDLFSSDLSNERLQETFGMIRKRGLLKTSLMVLYSGADQAVPDWVNKTALLGRWRAATGCGGKCCMWDERSGIIPNASHALSNDDQQEPRKDLINRVLGYLERLEHK